MVDKFHSYQGKVWSLFALVWLPCKVHRIIHCQSSGLVLKMRCRWLYSLQVTVLITVIVIAAIVVLNEKDSVETDSVEKDVQLKQRRTNYRNIQETSDLKFLQTSQGYVLTLDFTGQQIAGVRGIVSQQCWLGAFNLPMVIVEPFIIDSHMIHSTKLWGNAAQAQRFSDYFSLEDFNRHTTNPQVVKWEEFLQHAPRKIITVTIGNVFNKGCLQYTESMCTSRLANHDLINRFVVGCTQTSKMNDALYHLKARGFRHVKSVCLNCQDSEMVFTPDMVTRYIFGSHDPSKVTLLINTWKFTVQLSPQCQPSSSCGNFTSEVLAQRVKPSQKLQTYSDRYISSMHGSQTNIPKIAIMIRLEWYLIMQRNHILDTVETCLKKVVETFQNLTETKFHLGTRAQALLALDIGRYGSDTFDSTLEKHNLSTEYYNSLMEQMKSTVLKLYGGEQTFEEWEDTFQNATGDTEDRGLVAALQITIASKADCLVLMGGGHFQQIALQYYIQQHPNPTDRCIHYLCIPANFKSLIIGKINS